MTMAHSNKKIISYRSKLRGGHILNGQIIVKNGIIEEQNKFMAPCMSENFAGCVRHYSSQLVRVLFLRFRILAQNIYEHALLSQDGES